MQVLEAGINKYLLLELDAEFIGNIAKQAGFVFKIDDQPRVMSLNVSTTDVKLLCCCSTQQILATSAGFRAASFMSMEFQAACCRHLFGWRIRKTSPAEPRHMRCGYRSRKSCREPFVCRGSSW